MHPNVKVLIAHGGLRTIEEAIDREVPMVLIPLSYDQPYNAVVQVENGIAMQVDLNEFTVESLRNAIMEMTKEKYKENIKRIRAFAYDQMMTSLEEAVVNIEHLIKHNETFLFQNYEARLIADLPEFLYDIAVFFGRILVLGTIILRYLLW